MSSKHNSEYRLGTMYAIGAYAFWGFVPIYWKWFHHIPSAEVLSQRIIWAFAFYITLVYYREKDVFSWVKLFKAKETGYYIAIASFLLACNWMIYIWAVNHDHVVDASLGYFITPIVNVLMGKLLLGESLTKLKKISVILATAGVTLLILHSGQFPWIASLIAFTFSIYGFTRKRIIANVFHISAAEAFVLLVPATIGAIYYRSSAIETLTPSRLTLFMSAGIVTALPLLMFSTAAQRLPLSALGFLQFIAPTIQFLLATIIYDEPISSNSLMSFTFIWLGCGIFAWDAIKQNKMHHDPSAVVTLK